MCIIFSESWWGDGNGNQREASITSWTMRVAVMSAVGVVCPPAFAGVRFRRRKRWREGDWEPRKKKGNGRRWVSVMRCLGCWCGSGETNCFLNVLLYTPWSWLLCTDVIVSTHTNIEMGGGGFLHFLSFFLSLRSNCSSLLRRWSLFPSQHGGKIQQKRLTLDVLLKYIISHPVAATSPSNPLAFHISHFKLLFLTPLASVFWILWFGLLSWAGINVFLEGSDQKRNTWLYWRFVHIWQCFHVRPLWPRVIGSLFGFKQNVGKLYSTRWGNKSGKGKEGEKDERCTLMSLT